MIFGLRDEISSRLWGYTTPELNYRRLSMNKVVDIYILFLKVRSTERQRLWPWIWKLEGLCGDVKPYTSYWPPF